MSDRPQKKVNVVVVPHDPRWRDDFKIEASLIRRAFGDNVVAVHHIGSTSIPGIYAKPVIDMLVEVEDLRDVDARSPAMEALGYEVKGEFGIAGRRYFRKDNAAGIRTHQIHTFEAGSDEVIRHLAFRDYIIAHPDAAQDYSELKRKLAEQFPDDTDAYVDGKDEFIKDIDRRAAGWKSEV